MPYMFDNITKECKTWFGNSVKVKLEELYAKKWSETVYNNSSCLNYRGMTLVKQMQNYLVPFVYFSFLNHFVA